MPYSKCAVTGCENKDAHRHRFPNPKTNLDRFKAWIKACQNPKLYTLEPGHIYNVRRVCHIHFRSTDKATNMYLVKTAVPTMNLPSNGSAVTTSQDATGDTPKVVVMEEPCVSSSKWPTTSDTALEEDLEHEHTTVSFEDIITHKGTMVAYCCVPGCGNHDNAVSKRRFPYLNKELYDIWIERVGLEKIKTMPPEKVYKSYRVCNLHFNSKCNVPGSSKQKFGSLPTLYLPGFHEESEEYSIYRYGVSKNINANIHEGTSAKPKTPATSMISLFTHRGNKNSVLCL